MSNSASRTSTCDLMTWCFAVVTYYIGGWRTTKCQKGIHRCIEFLLRKQHPVSKHHKEGSRKLLFLLWIIFIQCCSPFSSRLTALRMFLVEAGLSYYFHNPLNSDMDYRIFNGRVWSFRIMYRHGGLWFRVSSEGLLQTGETLGREKNLARNGDPSRRWPCIHALSIVLSNNNYFI